MAIWRLIRDLAGDIAMAAALRVHRLECDSKRRVRHG